MRPCCRENPHRNQAGRQVLVDLYVPPGAGRQVFLSRPGLIQEATQVAGPSGHCMSLYTTIAGIGGAVAIGAACTGAYCATSEPVSIMGALKSFVHISPCIIH